MRWRFAVALGAAFAALAAWFWQSGHANGVEYVSAREMDTFGDASVFGGISALEFGPDDRAYLLTDRGTLFDAEFGKLGYLEIDGARILKDQTGAPLPRSQRDSEGLALLADGNLAISFEWEHRVEIFAPDGTRLARLEVPRDFEGMESNSGLEALAVSPEGALLAIPERSGAADRPFPVHVYKSGTWSRAQIERRGAFLPVGADFGPDGRLYLLERDFLLGFFRSRVRLFDWDGTALIEVDELLKTRFGAHGNLEGISVKASGPFTIIEMVSDNNFLSITPSEYMTYELKMP